MPAALVAKLAESTEISVAEAEKRWQKAKEIATAEKGLKESDGEEFWKYVTGVFRRSMGIGAVTESADICGVVHAAFITPYHGKPHVNTLLESATAEEIHAAAHEAATSHLNDLPQPTQAQLEAGNYRKGRIRLHGLDIVIENPKGSTRSGVDPDGKEWSVEMPYIYGYFSRTMAKDGDHVDCIIGDHPESELVFAVDQVDAETQKYDEPKIVMATRNLKEARDLYVSGFSDGKGGKRLGAITPMHVSGLKTWFEGDTTKPLSDAVLESAGAAVYVRNGVVLQVGISVEGNYSPDPNKPNPFTGTVTSARENEVDRGIGSATIKLDAPIDVWGTGKPYESIEVNLVKGGIVQDSKYREIPEAAEKAGLGHLFTVAEAREAAKRSPDYWKALMQDATTFDGIRGAFAAKWPEIFGAASPDNAINRLTNKQNGAIGQVSNTTEGDTMTEQQIAEFLLDQVSEVAARQRGFNENAAAFNAMKIPERIDYMNAVVFPAYEKAGGPAPYTAECLRFTSEVFGVVRSPSKTVDMGMRG